MPPKGKHHRTLKCTVHVQTITAGARQVIVARAVLRASVQPFQSPSLHCTLVVYFIPPTERHLLVPSCIKIPSQTTKLN